MNGPRITVVTGAASGIGEACARRLHQDGDIVVLADRGDVSGPQFEFELVDFHGGFGIEKVATQQLQIQTLHTFAQDDVEKLKVVEIRRLQFGDESNIQLDE